MCAPRVVDQMDRVLRMRAWGWHVGRIARSTGLSPAIILEMIKEYKDESLRIVSPKNGLRDDYEHQKRYEAHFKRIRANPNWNMVDNGNGVMIKSTGGQKQGRSRKRDRNGRGK